MCTMHALLLAHITPCYNNTKPFNKTKKRTTTLTLGAPCCTKATRKTPKNLIILKNFKCTNVACTQPMHLLQHTHHPLLHKHKTKQNKIFGKTTTLTFAKATTRKQF